jgi:hypothetical protein
VLGAVRREQQPATRTTQASVRSSPLALLAGMGILATAAVVAMLSFDHAAPHGSPVPTTKTGSAGTTTHASLRRIGSHAELVVSGMHEPPIGEVYELWLNRASGAPQPTDALFTVTSAGAGSVAVPGPLRGVREVMVTSEPLGGSSSPTSAAVLRLRVHPQP